MSSKALQSTGLRVGKTKGFKAEKLTTTKARPALRRGVS